MKTEANVANGVRSDGKPETALPAWHTSPAENLEEAIAWFKTVHPGWWFTVGERQVSCDASCGPTRESPDIELISIDRRFDDGFHADLPQPSTIAKALYNVMVQGNNARLSTRLAHRAGGA